MRVAELATLTFLAASIPSAVIAQSEAREAVRMMAHWRCSVWASMTNDRAGSEDQFEKGLQSARMFIEAARAGKISESDWDETVPVGVALTMSGPSNDFIAGRMFGFISDDAYDQVAKRDANGQILPPEEYILVQAVQSVIASNLLEKSNCSVL